VTNPASLTAQVALAARSRWCCASSVSPEFGSFACLDTHPPPLPPWSTWFPSRWFRRGSTTWWVGSAPTGQFRIFYGTGFGPAPR